MNIILPSIIAGLSGSGASGTADPALTSLVVAVVAGCVTIHRAWVKYKDRKRG